MKKYLFTLVVAAATGIGTFMAYGQPDTDVYIPPYLEENIQVNPGGGDDPYNPKEVECYCVRSAASPTCSVMGEGGYCGGDPCINHDTNCRK